MTLDEAIKHCEEVAKEKESEAQNLEYSKMDWKYEANQCSECAEDHRQLAEWLKELKAYREQGGDAISRQAVLDAIMANCIWENEYNLTSSRIKKAVESLPSVIPKQKTGRWIDSHIPESTLCECSACGFTCGAYSFNYCPDCGAKMQEVKE